VRALAALLVVLGTGCSSGSDIEGPENLVLISIDTLRPDFLGSYGYEGDSSPTLDALAREGVLFETAVTVSPWTLPAHASLFTGLNPGRHGVSGEDMALSEAVPTLAEILSSHGFATTGIVNSHYLSERYALGRGFDTWRYVVEFPSPLEPSLVESWAKEWIAGEPARPFFLFLHFYDTHSDYRSLPEYEALFAEPYTGPIDGSTNQLIGIRKRGVKLRQEDRARLGSLYAAGIRQLDDGIARILEALEDAGLLEHTLLVVTSDHGEEFAEHGGVLHGRTQYEEVMRIPLLLRGPGLPRGVRVSETASLIDVLPTVLGQLGVETPEGLDGLDLAPSWSGESLPQRTVFGGADHDPKLPNAASSARRGALKLVYDRRLKASTLYDLAADPGETRDARSDHPQAASELRAALDAFRAERPVADPVRLEALADDTLQQLEALGYVQRGAGSRAQP